MHAWAASFRRDPQGRMTPQGAFNADKELDGRNYYDVRTANYRTAHPLLAKELKGRHLQMIAIGGSIGTGLFISSGHALNSGGPATLILAYLMVGAMLYCVMQALGELAVVYPIAGSFSAYSTRFLDPAWGFAMGWNYALQWLIVLPLEIIGASITISYWDNAINKAVFVTIFITIIMTINLCGVRGYGEAEFVFAIVKVTAVIGFILLGIVINVGGGQDSGHIGGRYWQNPGAFNNGFKGLCNAFVSAAFAFAGTEMVGLAAAETANPRKSLPTAIKQVFWRISLFYIVALTLVGLLVPYNDVRLLGSKTSNDSSASPFVIAIQDAGIQVLPSVMNAVILMACMSVGNSAVFGSSRTLAALADQGQAPAILSYIDQRGRPLVAIIIAGVFGLLAYLANLENEEAVLSWLLSISALSEVFTWGSICLAHIRFRKAWHRKRRSVRELAFHAQAGVAGSWLGLLLNCLILVAQFWVGAWPIDSYEYSAAQNAQSFFLNYTAAPVVIVMYIGYKLWFRTSIVRTANVDLDTGRRGFNFPVLLNQERDERRSWPRWKKWYRFFC
ncbi:amino acid permease/ SLC12A domain-containing protein [Coniella lustricola]|uniref:Amino acid permease/ SLC12A domain-containing protein n=1 Tax=Coniella lustricola TaxID=2025994 RepID=A0A2T3ACD8_9PEZI|nr:amino acid permease/ SLC12A domain-containing protein [Coniella lustricola]